MHLEMIVHRVLSRLHQRCGGLEPQVSALPGQDCESAHAEGGFFDCLVVRSCGSLLSL